MARIICISNHKGGVGKTTIAANLGFSLARYFKVLLVDLDPQSNLSSGLGFHHFEETLAQYFKDVIHFRKPKVTPSVINAYVHIIPGNIDLLKIENQLKDTIRAEYILKEILSPIKSDYDVIILDCPPAFNMLTLNALNCSNLILVPAKPEVFSIHGIEFIRKFAIQSQIPFKIIFNQVNPRSRLHQKIMKNVTVHFKEILLNNYIRDTITLAEAFEHAQSIFFYKSQSLGAEDFTNVTDELIPYI